MITCSFCFHKQHRPVHKQPVVYILENNTDLVCLLKSHIVTLHLCQIALEKFD